MDDARNRGISLSVEPFLVREINPFKDLLALIRLMLFIKTGRYDIVHTHSSKAGVLGRWAAYFAKTPILVHTVHGWGHNESQHSLLRDFYISVEKITQQITDKLIEVSPLDIKKGL